MERVTIAIPTRNSGATLGATLESLRPLKDFAEIFVIDSDSVDDTRAIAEQYKVQLLHADPGNLYRAVNIGLEAGKAEWITYINSDDLLYSSTLVERIKSNSTNVDILYGTVDFIDYEGRFLRSWHPAGESSLLPLYKAGFSAMLQQGTLIKRSLFEALGGFSADFQYVSDADFWFRSLEAGAEFRYSGPRSVGAFRLHGTQITQLKMKEMHAEHWRMVQAHGGPVSGRRAWQHLWRWRFRNVGSYLERWHRAHRIGASKIFCGSYDLP